MPRGMNTSYGEKMLKPTLTVLFPHHWLKRGASSLGLQSLPFLSLVFSLASLGPAPAYGVAASCPWGRSHWCFHQISVCSGAFCWPIGICCIKGVSSDNWPVGCLFFCDVEAKILCLLRRLTFYFSMVSRIWGDHSLPLHWVLSPESHGHCS